MAKSSYLGANLTVSTHTFRNWLDRTNQLAYDLGTIVLTAAANSTGETTTGNVNLNGTFKANVVAVGTTLRGGTVAAAANLAIGSNVIISANTFQSDANTLFSNTVYITAGLNANAGAVLSGATINISATTLNVTSNVNMTGSKTFGAMNTLSFTESANNSNRQKFIRLSNTNLLEFASLNLDDLGDVDAASPVDGQFLKYETGSGWVAAALDEGGAFEITTLDANTVVARRLADLGDLTEIGYTGWALEVYANTTGNTSGAIFKANTVSFANSDVLSIGAITKVRVTGGANNQAIIVNDSTGSNLTFATIDKDWIFPASAVTTVGANLFTIHRSGNVISIGANSVPASYIFGVRGNMHANGDILVTGNVSAVGVSGAFTGDLTGTASNATLLNNQPGSYYTNATNISTGTLNAARLPYSMDQAVSTTSDPTFRNVTVSNLTINGTTTTINSTITTIDDPIITLGGDTAPSADDNKDRGVEARWHNGSAAKVAFFGMDDTDNAFMFIPDATNTSEVFTGTLGNAKFWDLALSGNVTVAGISTFTGNAIPSGNTTNLGTTARRWVLVANTGDFSSTLNVSGLSTLAGANVASGTLNVVGASALQGVVTFSANANPSSNTQNLGVTAARWQLFANNIDVTGTSTIAGIATHSANLNPSSNAISLGISTARWILNANTGDFSGVITVGGLATFNAGANVALGGLNVVNAAAFGNTTSHAGLATFSAGANVASGILNVVGNTALGGNLSVTGVTSFANTPTLDYTAASLTANAIGYRGLPINNQNAAYTVVIDDDGRLLRFSNTTGNTFSIANVATTNYPIGFSFGYRNINSGVLRIAPGTGVTLRIAGSATNATANVSQWGYGTVTQEASDIWVISGTGLS